MIKYSQHCWRDFAASGMTGIRWAVERTAETQRHFNRTGISEPPLRTNIGIINYETTYDS
jgi:hypothetical protein